MHEELINHLVKLAQEQVWLGELTISTDWVVKYQTKQTNKISCSIILLNCKSCHNDVCMGESFQDYSWFQDFEADFPKKVRLKILN